MQVFFSHVAHSRNDVPYLPPTTSPGDVVGVRGRAVEIVGLPPTGIDGAEQIVSAQHLAVPDAIEWLSDCDDPTSAEVLRFAAHLELV